PRRWYLVINARAGLIDNLAPRQRLAHANTELSIIAAQHTRANLTDALLKDTNRTENIAPERHVRAEQIANWRRSLGQATIGAAHDPMKLSGEPSRLASQPERLDRSTHCNHIGIAVLYS